MDTPLSPVTVAVGATGAIGEALCRKLEAKDATLVLADRLDVGTLEGR